MHVGKNLGSFCFDLNKVTMFLVTVNCQLFLKIEASRVMYL